MITTQQLTQPLGELDAAFFPDGNLDKYLVGWLQQAQSIVGGNPAIVEADAATAAYVYMRAYQFLATRYNTLATTTTIAAQITRTIQDAQIQYYLGQREKWAGRYAGYAQGQTDAELIALSVAPRLLFTVS